MRSSLGIDLAWTMVALKPEMSKTWRLLPERHLHDLMTPLRGIPERAFFGSAAS